MKMTFRKKTRELLIRLIFQMSSTGDFSNAAKDAFLADTSLYTGNENEGTLSDCIFDEQAGEEPDLNYLNLAFLCVRDNLTVIDVLINNASKGWSVDRMSMVDLAILRVATAEIRYIDDIDNNVSVNEAVLLSKKYGSEKSAVFINGILGTITRARDEELS